MTILAKKFTVSLKDALSVLVVLISLGVAFGAVTTQQNHNTADIQELTSSVRSLELASTELRVELNQTKEEIKKLREELQ